MTRAIPKFATIDAAYRAMMRQVFARQVTPVVWQECVDALVTQASAGNLPAYKLLEPWAMGQPADLAPTEPTVATRMKIILPDAE